MSALSADRSQNLSKLSDRIESQEAAPFEEPSHVRGALPQTLVAKVEKLSKTGRLIHARLLALANGQLSYYRIIPETFNENDPSFLAPLVAKFALQVEAIGAVSELEASEAKGKLKGKGERTMAVRFNDKDMINVPEEKKRMQKAKEKAEKDAQAKQKAREKEREKKKKEREKKAKSGGGDESAEGEDDLEDEQSRTPPLLDTEDAKELPIRPGRPSGAPNTTWFFVFVSAEERASWVKEIEAQRRNGPKSSVIDRSLSKYLPGEAQREGSARVDASGIGVEEEEKGAHSKVSLSLERFEPNFAGEEGEDEKRHSNTSEIFNIEINEDGLLKDAHMQDEEVLQNDINPGGNAKANLALKELQSRVEDRYEKSVALLDRKKKKEAMAWDLKFQNYWSNVVSADQNYKDGRTYSERFVHHVGVFRERAEALAKRIVEEMHLPHSHRTMKPFVNVPVEFSVFEDDDRNTEIYS